MSDDPKDLAARALRALDTATPVAGPTMAVVDQLTGDIVQRPVGGGPAEAADGGLDYEELDLAMVAFASDQPIDGRAFLAGADHDGDRKLDQAELTDLLARLDDVARRSLAVKLGRLEDARAAFDAARPRPGLAGKVRLALGGRARLHALDDALQAARLDFVAHLVDYAEGSAR